MHAGIAEARPSPCRAPGKLGAGAGGQFWGAGAPARLPLHHPLKLSGVEPLRAQLGHRANRQ